MKRFLSVLFALLLALTLLAPAAFAAGSASAAIMLSSTSVTLGNSVKVTVKYTATEGIGSWNFLLKYDKGALQYVSGADSGSAGVLRFVGFRDEGNVKTVTQTVTFKTLKVGSTTVSTNTLEIVSASSISKMAASNASAVIKVKAKPDDTTKNTTKSTNKSSTSAPTTVSASNADLSALKISPGKLAPAFSPSKTEYAVSVDYAVTSLVVSAQTKNPDAEKTLSPTALQVGDNIITITVTAPSGKQKTYKLIVTRGESPLSGVKITVGAVVYTPVCEGLSSPGKGFTETTVKYENETLPAYAAPGKLYTLVCLMSPSNEKGWFMYDAATGLFTKYTTVSSKAVNYVIFDVAAGTAAPSGYVLQDTTVGGNTVSAFVSTDSANPIIIVSAMKADGTKGLYYYDAQDGTFMKYTAEAAQAAATADDYNTLAQKLQAAEKNLSYTKVFMVICAGLYAVLLVLGAVWFVRLKRSRTEE